MARSFGIHSASHRYLFRTALVCLLDAAAARAQVITDGSLGRAGALAGPDFAVTAGLGRQVGPNLFHSFQQFDLAAGQTATFSGPADVARVLARVTGGAPSTIDGTLRCTIPGADLYLMNPPASCSALTPSWTCPGASRRRARMPSGWPTGRRSRRRPSQAMAC